MSGVEIIGTTAAACQFISYTIRAIWGINELRERIKETPAKIQDCRDQLDELADTILQIKRNEALHTEIMQDVLEGITKRTGEIAGLLQKTPNPGRTTLLKRAASFRSFKNVEKTLRNKFDALETAKTNLLLLMMNQSRSSTPLSQIRGDMSIQPKEIVDNYTRPSGCQLSPFTPELSPGYRGLVSQFDQSQPFSAIPIPQTVAAQMSYPFTFPTTGTFNVMRGVDIKGDRNNIASSGLAQVVRENINRQGQDNDLTATFTTRNRSSGGEVDPDVDMPDVVNHPSGSQAPTAEWRATTATAS
ncbi:hypothetical protein DL771_001847 [Monosporascus sp. 5C6A]|nr:hypothetical protein DL771_001847 [Monosporascus sp. 5C6A]